MSNIVEKFLRYIQIDTVSDPTSKSSPSTHKQFDLAHVLVGELKSLGLQDVTCDENCYVMGSLPSNMEKKVPAIGFIAHMDTSPDMSGADVKAKLIENYDGGEIVLNPSLKIMFSPQEFPDLLKYTGQSIITTDGTTLLGADDKAGIAEIMVAVEYLVMHPEIKHGAVKVGFTPDEEIGRGTNYFDLQKFGADFAYTLDGGEVGTMQYENFNAAEAKIVIHGKNVHPGVAKNKMLNAIFVAMELNNMLPLAERPELTEKYEGFYHLNLFHGNVEETKIEYIIRDHDKAKFEIKKTTMQKVCTFLNDKYGAGIVDLKLRDQYFNMKELLLPAMYIVNLASDAMKAVGLEPTIGPIRGGTDGAGLSYKGLLTPNIFTGGHYAHGKYEFVPVRSMEKAVEVVLKIIELNTLR
jgi:tripeptide aminopeptidase